MVANSIAISPKIECQHFYEELITHDVDFFTGVPDSLLKNICAYITDHSPKTKHIITPNEGNAVALASGYHLATGKIPLVYMQNSGLGNAINPLTSLADPEVYAIPMLLLIGWRGEPGVKDEPQHVKMGRINPAMLDVLEVPFAVLPTDWVTAQGVLETAIQSAKKNNTPFALLVRENTFAPYQMQGATPQIKNALSRETAIIYVAQSLPKEALVVATTGKISRELYEYRKRQKASHAQDFLVVGAMGHTAQIALGLALAQPKKYVFCLDGDGSVLMHMGSLGTIGAAGCVNFKHIILNNWAHESVGGQPTIAGCIDLPGIAKACGYQSVYRATTATKLTALMHDFLQTNGPSLLEIQVELGSRSDLGRPGEKPVENKRKFMEVFQHDRNACSV